MRANFDTLNVMAEEIIRITHPSFIGRDAEPLSLEQENLVRQKGIAANEFGGIEAMQAVFHHVLTLTRVHLGYEGGGGILESKWNGIGDWRW